MIEQNTVHSHTILTQGHLLCRSISECSLIMDSIGQKKEYLKIEQQQINIKQSNQRLQDLNSDLILDEPINFQYSSVSLVMQTIFKKRENVNQASKQQNEYQPLQCNQTKMDKKKRQISVIKQKLGDSSLIQDSDIILGSLQELDQMIQSSSDGSSNSGKENTKPLYIISQESDSSYSQLQQINRIKKEADYRKEQPQNQDQSLCSNNSLQLSSRSLQKSETPKIQDKKSQKDYNSFSFSDQNKTQLNQISPPKDYSKNQNYQEGINQYSSSSKSCSKVLIGPRQLLQIRNDQCHENVQKELCQKLGVNYNCQPKKQFKQQQEIENFRKQCKFINQLIYGRRQEDNSLQEINKISQNEEKCLNIRKQHNNKRYISIQCEQQKAKQSSSCSDQSDLSQNSQMSGESSQRSVSKKVRKSKKKKNKMDQQPNFRSMLRTFQKLPRLIDSIQHLTQVLKMVACGLMSKIEKQDYDQER